MSPILIRSGDVAPGPYEVREVAIGIERVELQEADLRHYGTLGVTTLGVPTLSFTAHLVDGGTFQAVTDQESLPAAAGRAPAIKKEGHPSPLDHIS